MDDPVLCITGQSWAVLLEAAIGQHESTSVYTKTNLSSFVTYKKWYLKSILFVSDLRKNYKLFRLYIIDKKNSQKQAK